MLFTVLDAEDYGKYYGVGGVAAEKVLDHIFMN
jgi:hypothetical protein